MAKNNRKKRKAKKARLQQPEEIPENDFYDEDDEDNLCRCICGDNDFAAKRPWIQCTDCSVWQHNDCMDVSVFDDELDDHYWCEQCAPEMHAGLLAELARGERGWEIRCALRLDAKAQFEWRIAVVMEQLEWLWEMYEPQPSAVAGKDTIIPSKRPAPSHYVSAVQVGLDALFGDLPMHSLRDLARRLDASNGRCGVMKMLRKKAAPEYSESDVHMLGVLSELFEWAEKGKFFTDQPSDAALDSRQQQVASSSSHVRYTWLLAIPHRRFFGVQVNLYICNVKA